MEFDNILEKGGIRVFRKVGLILLINMVRSETMPVVTVGVSKLSKEQKRELVATLTKSASNIMNIPEHAYAVYLKENDIDNIGGARILLSEKSK